MKKLICLTLVVMAVLSSTQALGAASPLAISIIPPIQFPPSDFNVPGIRASVLWGKHRSVYGIDIGGLGNITDQEFVGLAVAGGFNATRGHTTIIGLQAAGGANVNSQETKVVGIQAAIGVNYNSATSTVVGLQVAGIANLSAHTNVYGFQVGLYNKAHEVYGFQIGLVNSATELHGLQIGLINFHEKGVFAVCPILNFGF